MGEHRSNGERKYYLSNPARCPPDLTRRRLKNGVFHSVVDLQAAINRFISEHNGNSRAFVWKADPAKLIADVRRGHQTLESIH